MPQLDLELHPRGSVWRSNQSVHRQAATEVDALREQLRMDAKPTCRRIPRTTQRIWGTCAQRNDFFALLLSDALPRKWYNDKRRSCCICPGVRRSETENRSLGIRNANADRGAIYMFFCSVRPEATYEKMRLFTCPSTICWHRCADCSKPW